MNRIFSVVWNASKNCYVVTSELAKRHGKVASAVIAAIVLSAQIGTVSADAVTDQLRSDVDGLGNALEVQQQVNQALIKDIYGVVSNDDGTASEPDGSGLMDRVDLLEESLFDDEGVVDVVDQHSTAIETLQQAANDSHKAIEDNKTAIEANKALIEKNTAGIEANKQAVENTGKQVEALNGQVGEALELQQKANEKVFKDLYGVTVDAQGNASEPDGTGLKDRVAEIEGALFDEDGVVNAVDKHSDAIDTLQEAADDSHKAIEANKTAIEANKTASEANKTAVEELNGRVTEIEGNLFDDGGVVDVVDQHSDAIDTLQQAANDSHKAIEANKTAIEENKKATDTNKKAIDANKTAIEANKMAGEANKALIEKNTAGIEGNKTAIAGTDKKVDDAVKAQNTVNNSVAGQLADHESRITKNAEAIQRNINQSVGGLAQSVEKLDGRVTSNTARISGLEQRTNQVESDIKAVGSSAAALAALKPLQYNPGYTTQIMAGVGTYRGKTATALGVAHYANENLMFHAGAALGGHHGFMANAGLTVGIGSGETQPMRAGEMAELRALVADLQAENNRMRMENNEIKNTVAQLMAKVNGGMNM